MRGMFSLAKEFNQPLHAWHMGSVKDMCQMFYKAIAFNQPLDSWDISNVKNIDRFLHDDTTFNQPLPHWDMAKAVNWIQVFVGSYNFYRRVLANNKMSGIEQRPSHKYNLRKRRKLDDVTKPHR